jgi:hypothetical protein
MKFSLFITQTNDVEVEHVIEIVLPASPKGQEQVYGLENVRPGKGAGIAVKDVLRHIAHNPGVNGENAPYRWQWIDH